MPNITSAGAFCDFKRYSMKALDELQKAFKTVDMDKIWSLNNPTGKPPAPSSATSS